MDELRTRINVCILSTKVPKSNLTKEKVCALNTLRKDNFITILPADNGRCTVILDKKYYYFKVKQLLDDQKTYSVKKDYTSAIKHMIISKLNEQGKHGYVDSKLKHHVYQTSEYLHISMVYRKSIKTMYLFVQLLVALALLLMTLLNSLHLLCDL